MADFAGALDEATGAAQADGCALARQGVELAHYDRTLSMRRGELRREG